MHFREKQEKDRGSLAPLTGFKGRDDTFTQPSHSTGEDALLPPQWSVLALVAMVELERDPHGNPKVARERADVAQRISIEWAGG